MFVREKDAGAELWEGARSGVQAAVDVFNADEVTLFLQAPSLNPQFTRRMPRHRQQISSS